MDLIKEIKKGFKGDVLDDEETLKIFSRDASIFEVKPKLVVFPKDAKDVQHLVNFVKNKIIPVIINEIPTMVKLEKYDSNCFLNNKAIITVNIVAKIIKKPNFL